MQIIFKRICLIRRYDANRFYNSRVDLGVMIMKMIFALPDLQR